MIASVLIFALLFWALPAAGQAPSGPASSKVVVEARYSNDPFRSQPQVFLKVAQCGSFITEDPAHAADYLRDIDIPAMLESFDANPALPEGFRQKARAISSLCNTKP